MLYLIASVRGSDFQIEASTPEEALANLRVQEQDTGRLWRINCPYRNRNAVEQQGFTFFDPKDPSRGAYKKVL